MNINMTWLKGKKTYIVAVVGIVVNGLYAMGYIPAEYIPVINMILGFMGLATLRAGMSNQ